MKNTIHWLFSIGVILFLGVVPPNVLAQAEEPAQIEEPAVQPEEPTVQGEQPGEAEEEPAKVIAGLEQEGELKAVDPDKSIFLLVDQSGKELLFHYDGQTEVADHTEGVEGLSGESGTWLRIQYRAEGENAIAEKIEMTEQLSKSEAEADSPEQPEASPEPEMTPELR